MARRSLACVFVAGSLACLGTHASAKDDGGTAAAESDAAPTPAPLTVGSMAIASDSALAIEGMAVDIEGATVTYAYRLHNKGKSKLALAASVSLPDLEVSSEGNLTYLLPSRSDDNPIDLAVKSNNAPVPTTPYVQALALGIDRQAELKAAGLPLVPFGAATDKAIAGTKPDVLAKLIALGLLTPRDPSEPDTPLIADWSLHVVRGWTQALDPESITNVTVTFAPIKAVYHVSTQVLNGFTALKEQVCLTPQIIAAAKGLATGKGATVDVQDITLANDGPARWLDNPPATIAVRKPKPNSVVAFCGMAANAANQPVVTGKMPGSNDAAGLRVLVFSPSGS